MASSQLYVNHSFVIEMSRKSDELKEKEGLKAEQQIVERIWKKGTDLNVPVCINLRREKYNGWKNGRIEIPPSAVKIIAAVLGIANPPTEPEMAAENQRCRNSAIPGAGSEFLRTLAMLRPEESMEKVFWKSRDEAENAFVNVLRLMERNHFLVGTTLTVQVSGFPTAAYTRVFKEVCDAMDEGALFAFIIPSCDKMKKLRSLHPIFGMEINEHTHDNFLVGFNKAWDAYEVHRRDDLGADSRQATGERMQLFQWPFDFPITPCGRTISLLGESIGRGRVSFKIIERGPHSNGEISIVPDNDRDHRLLRGFIETVVQDKTTIYKRFKSAADEKSRQFFIEELINRLQGNCQPSGRPETGRFPILPRTHDVTRNLDIDGK